MWLLWNLRKGAEAIARVILAMVSDLVWIIAAANYLLCDLFSIISDKLLEISGIAENKYRQGFKTYREIQDKRG